jgi:hypothetical protein
MNPARIYSFAHKPNIGLSAQTQPFHNCSVSLCVLSLQVAQLPTSLADQFEQAPARVFIVFVSAQMVRELVNAAGQQRNLHLWRPCVIGVEMVFLDQAFFLCLGQWHSFLLKK